MATIAAAHYAKAEQALQTDPIVWNMAQDVLKGVWEGTFSLDKLDMGTCNARFRQLEELNPKRPYAYKGEHGFHLGAVKNAIIAEVNESIAAREGLISMVEQAQADGTEVPPSVIEAVERLRSTRKA